MTPERVSRHSHKTMICLYIFKFPSIRSLYSSPRYTLFLLSRYKTCRCKVEPCDICRPAFEHFLRKFRYQWIINRICTACMITVFLASRLFIPSWYTQTCGIANRDCIKGKAKLELYQPVVEILVVFSLQFLMYVCYHWICVLRFERRTP